MLPAFASLAMALPAFAQGPDVAAKKLERAGFAQNLGTQIPLDLTFTDENGQRVQLAKYFTGEKPVILTMNYFGCPMLCTLVLNGVVTAVKELPYKVGQEFQIITVSFDPNDKPAIAMAKKVNYLQSLGQEGASNGWHFLTGRKDQIDLLCKATGFSYVAPETMGGEYGHAIGIMVATTKGELSHYFFGAVYEPRDIRLALVDASLNQIGSPVVNAFLHFCYRYDPKTGKFSFAIMNLVRAGAALTVGGVGLFMLRSLRREARARKVAVAV